MYPQIEQDNHPNLFAVIPAKVRYDKNLSSTAKLIFAEISALSGKEGYCWASNAYFADLYGCTKDTISRVISELEKYGYISVIIDKVGGNKRRIYALFDHYSAPKKVQPVRKNPKNLSVKKPQGNHEKTYHNNTSNNTSKIREENALEKTQTSNQTEPGSTLNQVVPTEAVTKTVKPLPSEKKNSEDKRAATYYEKTQYENNAPKTENYTTDSDLVAVMRNYYTNNPNEYKVGILQDAKGARFTKEQIQDFIRMWAAHAIENNKMHRTAHQLHLMLKQWILRESQFSQKLVKNNKAEANQASAGRKKTIDIV